VIIVGKRGLEVDIDYSVFFVYCWQ
jgi:hypothetical protein